MLKITQFSDPHLTSAPEGLKGYDTFARFQRCVEDALRKSENIEDEIFILSGDIAHDESLETYESLKEFQKTSGARWFCIPGNHDAPELLHQVLQTQAPAPELGWMSTSLSTELGILFFSSHVPGEVGGELNEQSLEILGRPDGQSKLVVLHHPPLRLGDPEFDAMALFNQDRFWEEIERNPDIIGVLFGHAHREYFELRRLSGRDVSVLCCPSTAFQYGTENNAPYGFDPQRIGYRQLWFSDEQGLKTEVCWLNA